MERFDWSRRAGRMQTQKMSRTRYRVKIAIAQISKYNYNVAARLIKCCFLDFEWYEEVYRYVRSRIIDRVASRRRREVVGFRSRRNKQNRWHTTTTS